MYSKLWAQCDGNLDMFMQLIAMHSNKLVKYVQSHAYFINTFIINRKEVFTMDKYKLLCIDCGIGRLKTRKTGEVKTGTSYYLVVHKADNCKPMVFKGNRKHFPRVL